MKRAACLILALFFISGCTGWLFATKAGNRLDAGMKAIHRGNDLYGQGCYRAALQYYSKANEIFTADDRLAGVALSLNNMGNIYRATGDADSALLFYQEAFITYQGINDHKGMLQSLSNKAAALIGAGRYDEARKVIDAAELVSGKKPFVPLLTNRGLLDIKTGKVAEAEKVLNKARAYSGPDDRGVYATVNFVYGTLMADTGRYDEALKYFNAALLTDKKAGFHKGIADDLFQIGSVYLKQEKYAAAADAWERSIKIYALIGDTEKIKPLLAKLTDAAGKAGMDITLTTHFVNQWLEGRADTPPCE